MSPIAALLRRAAHEVVLLSGGDSLAFRDKQTDPDGSVDLVTEGDLLVDRLITEGIADLFPGVPVVSEERPLPPEAGHGDVFVLDPVDGTHNFAAGVPWWTISLARVRGSRVEEGWILQLPAGRLYHASRTTPATCEGELLQVSSKRPELSLLSMGLSEGVTPLLLGIERFAGARLMGCHSLALCWSAEGRFGAHASRGWPWDVAAGYLIVERAGGVVRNFDGSPPDLWVRDYAVVGAPQVVDAALEIIREAAPR
jgi:myo-inositol-1(or 4)-monophosphatase